MYCFILQFGLYASFAGGFVYAFMGTCPQINIGPTALLSLLTFTYTNGTNPDFAILLCLVGGIIQLIAGISQLGMYYNLLITVFNARHVFFNIFLINTNKIQ